MKRTALIVGATGGIGGETARALLRSGWSVRALLRGAGRRPPEDMPGVEWVTGDALNEADVVLAARGAQVVVHAANPAGYKNWQGLVLPMLRNSIAAARSAGARLVFPGSVYNFGPDAFPLLSEQSPQHPLTRKGRMRVEMEEMLLAASREGVPVLVVRAGDYFGTHAGNSWFGQALVKPGRALRSIVYPGRADAGHAWAYLPDVAETIARLLDREADLETFAVCHFEGHYVESGIQMAEAVRRVAGAPGAPIRNLPWFAMKLVAPFNETFREILEMRYLWETPVRLDNRKLVAFLGAEPHTPLDSALRETLEGLGVVRREASAQRDLGEAGAT